ncbi:FUSC family protein [Listeria ivanovii]|uniref:Integral membrane bound transporter domain-containing protein n=1 Tax=Listeria ivanovii (strain ATCC BAA-678 / PAM 55) TaxID=881621 RepID=G2ZE84_LISIP|nr:FUSC family protein [Listeria ivanovii]AHI55525.1 membrane protein [Listeria ivanovii WSLC3009]AIS64980.1 membrane protein [Listeria ivanovii subsp. ivanovii]MBC1758303.1 FUSC family protein [Listeria ivanovii]MBK3913180.1 FUSC family protein [Listeria ivanovii subsp. ivanovii]MBK3920703.1 FUSC family protein [Listeria ivanovii subsp. ivanovii]
MKKISLKERFALDPRVSKSLISITIAILLFPIMGDWIVYPTYVFNAIYITAQMTRGATYKSSIERIVGTIIGGLLAAVVYLLVPNHHYIMIPVGAALAVMLSYLFTKKFTMVIVVITVMVLVGKGDGEPIVFLRDRLLDTMIGLVIGFLVYALYPRKKSKKMNQVFTAHEKNILEQVKAVDVNSESANQLEPKIKSLWKQLIDLRNMREQIITDSSFVPNTTFDDPMFQFTSLFEKAINHIEILYHVTLDKAKEPEYEIVYAYHQKACVAVINEMETLIEEHK